MDKQRTLEQNVTASSNVVKRRDDSGRGPCVMRAPHFVRLHFWSSRPTGREPEEGAPLVAVEVDGKLARRASEPLVPVLRPRPFRTTFRMTVVPPRDGVEAFAVCVVHHVAIPRRVDFHFFPTNVKNYDRRQHLNNESTCCLYSRSAIL